VARERAYLSQLGGNDPGHGADGCPGRLSCLPRSPESAGHVETVDRVRESLMKISTPKLPVRDNLESEVFLPGKHAQDVLILELPQLVRSGTYSELRASLRAAENFRRDPP